MLQWNWGGFPHSSRTWLRRPCFHLYSLPHLSHPYFVNPCSSVSINNSLKSALLVPELVPNWGSAPCSQVPATPKLKNWSKGEILTSVERKKGNLISSNRNKMYKSRYIFCSLRFFWQWSINMTTFCDMMPCSLTHRYQNFPLKKVEQHSSNMPISVYLSTWHYSPNDCGLHTLHMLWSVTP